MIREELKRGGTGIKEYSTGLRIFPGIEIQEVLIQGGKTFMPTIGTREVVANC